MSSFPIIYFGFVPDFSIPVYPRDYFFQDGDKHCLGFDYVEDRVILGAGFMKNHDIQFDRVESVVRIVRAECQPGEYFDPNFDFARHYTRHNNDTTWVR